MDTTVIRNALVTLHKAIIDAERVRVESLEGRITGGEMLRRLIVDERFSWLQPLTELIARLEDEEETAAEHIAAARRLLAGEGPEAFRNEYARLLQESPAVVMAHAAATRRGGELSAR